MLVNLINNQHLVKVYIILNINFKDFQALSKN